ncbi:MAG: diphthamide synthesis protein [archaeon]
MKIIFVPSKSKEKIDTNYFLNISKLFPKNIAIVYSIQYESLAKEAKEILKKKHNITKFSQVLGCSKLTFSKETSAVLLIGSGMFHALSLASSRRFQKSHDLSLASISNLPIYIYEQGKLSRIQEKEVERFKQHKKAAYVQFLSSNKVGVLISTKSGQQNLSRALNLKRKFKKKKLYFFIGDFLSAQEFENFRLNSWVNTACPRLDMDNASIINMGDLE